MAMTYTQQATWAADTANQDLVKQAMLEYAATVQAEASTVTNHTLRADFAARVTAEPDYWKPQVTANIATDAAMTTTPNDALLLASVTTAWNRMSAVPGAA